MHQLRYKLQNPEVMPFWPFGAQLLSDLCACDLVEPPFPIPTCFWLAAHSCSCQASCWHFFNDSYEQDLRWSVFPQLFMRYLWVTRLVSRMNSLARPSSELIRCTEYEAASLPHQSYCTWERRWENTKLHCTLSLNLTQLTLSSLSFPRFISIIPHLLFLCPLFTPHQVTCIVILLSWCRTLLSYVLWKSKIKTELPSGIIRHRAAPMNLNCFWLHRIPLRFIIKCKVMAETVDWRFLHALLIILYRAHTGNCSNNISLESCLNMMLSESKHLLKAS